MIFETKTTAKSKMLFFINIAYFALALIQIVAELIAFNTTALSIRIVLPLLLMALYYINSIKKDVLFYVTMALLLISNVLFFYVDRTQFFYGIIVFILLRMVTLVMIFRLTQRKNYLHIIVASFPFLVIFFYLISATNEISDHEFNLLIFQSVLIALLGGVSVVSYFKNDNRQNSWLLISTLLFVGLLFIVFIERYFISNLSLIVYRPIEIILSVFAFYTFYKYLIAAESKEHKTL